jgi:hypothetical protein
MSSSFNSFEKITVEKKISASSLWSSGRVIKLMSRTLLLSVLLLFAAATVAARPKWHELEGYTFEQYVLDFGRTYERGSDEWKLRESIFNKKLDVMIRHNKDLTNTWRRGVNQFTDLTDAEWSRFNRAYKSPNRWPPTEVFVATGISTPMEMDYRTWTSPRVITDVKHQGSCGSCWAPPSGILAFQWRGGSTARNDHCIVASTPPFAHNTCNSLTEPRSIQRVPPRKHMLGARTGAVSTG